MAKPPTKDNDVLTCGFDKAEVTANRFRIEDIHFNRGEAPRRQQRRAPVAAAPAAVLDVELTQEPVLECTFRMADGWEETMCSVCQSEMADGEKVRVLTACTHSFHTTCVEQWLRDHATCPLCRAPTSAAPAKDRRHRRPTT
ncbi:hypothetical protein BDA96_05G245400 [Sorghum bicolor]|uniref:RING-type domain-containing protein n=2 Tax=Sorghum bicolor TaxID=4558 RepID=A0A921R011_SORBI|nr:hypothetical protein SORBI_3005G227700 [Sorghum bicolor]KAG0531107.1 hypothetical protein BDA96_05G245400 [Sorghum bicolor]